MLRVWLCYFVMLGTISSATADIAGGDRLSCQAEIAGGDGIAGQVNVAGQADIPAPAIFGLQVHLGVCNASQKTFRNTNFITQTGYASEPPEADDPEGLLTPETGPKTLAESMDEPIYDVSEGIGEDYQWRVLPAGFMYHSYVAGEKESGIRSVWLTDKNRGLIWETALGGRFSFLRYGTDNAAHPEGWQFDFEGAALPRVDPHLESSPLIAVDFRMGLLSTWSFGPNAFKMGYYHLSSHIGDEFLIANPAFVRLNYVRDSGIVGWTHNFTPAAQIYGEIAYAFGHEDGALPLEMQYGVQYRPPVPGIRGAPFCGINGHTRQDFGYGTSLNIVAGWQWWSAENNSTFRIGGQYYDGPSLQYSFVNRHETLTGWGMWFDY